MKRSEELTELNGFPVYSVYDSAFSRYGRTVKGFSSDELVRCSLEKTDIPDDGNVYVASFGPFEETEDFKKIQTCLYGGLGAQAGYCNGRNSTVNGFEYHKASEINIAVTDFCLALGHCADIKEDLSYDVRKAGFFYVPQGTCIEMYGTTLHLSPLKTGDSGFKCIVILPKGTNTPLNSDEKMCAKKAYEKGDYEARLLLQRSKWVISHPEREPLIKQGAYPGVTGENTPLKY